jgi:predicted type IV restriction endonuclease
MQEHLVSVVQALRGDVKGILLMDEAKTQLAVVLRLLSALGWDHFDTGEVTPQYSIGALKVDYALQLAHAPKVFIEVKRPSMVDLDCQEEQLLKYAFQSGVPLAVLTNGIQWRFYLPLLPGKWPQRRFWTCDLSTDKPQAMGKRLFSILARENVASGKAVSTAKTWLEKKKKQEASEKALPTAWNEIIQKPDEALVELLIKATQSISGAKPGIQLTKQFLAKHKDHLLLLDTLSSNGWGETHDGTSNDDGPGKKKNPIWGFVFLGTYYPVSTWKGLLTTLSWIVYQKHTTRFPQVLTEPTLKGTECKYFSRDAQELHAPGKIGDSGYYVETKVSSDRAKIICRRLLKVFGYSSGDLTIDTKGNTTT